MYGNEMNGKHMKPFLKICNGAKYSAGGIAETSRVINLIVISFRQPSTYLARL